MTSYEIDPTGVYLALSGVAGHAESLAAAGRGFGTAGRRAEAALRRCGVVADAFDAFLSPREDMGDRLARNLLRKSDAVVDATAAFAEADGAMSAAASTAMSQVNADLALDRRAGGPEPH
ncbi:DUF6507 family protein [Tersicoccus sp. MR15.9]|uniref:DUF6507 family protein n=1 Tax=Tersicoccus mangrovi TaxID=3121635 RepID=UPI002FE61784